MAHFTLAVDAAAGPVVLALVMPSRPRIDALTANNQPTPQPVPIRALVDTGASVTCVDPAVM
jgi:hypothetical protein